MELNCDLSSIVFVVAFASVSVRESRAIPTPTFRNSAERDGSTDAADPQERQLPFGFAGLNALPAPGFGLTPGLQLASTAPALGLSALPAAGFGLTPGLQLASTAPALGLTAGLRAASISPAFGLAPGLQLASTAPGYGLSAGLNAASVSPGFGLTPGLQLASVAPGFGLTPVLRIASHFARPTGYGGGLLNDEEGEGSQDGNDALDAGDKLSSSGDSMFEISGADVKEVIIVLQSTGRHPIRNASRIEADPGSPRTVTLVPHDIFERGKRFRLDTKAAQGRRPFDNLPRNNPEVQQTQPGVL